MSSMIDEIYRRMDDEMEKPDIDLSDSKIREFFADKTIFLSGATGYVGKVFIEKILRDCPQLKRLYVLVRHKKGVAPEDTMKRYFDNVIFDKLRSLNPTFAEKVTTIPGDLQQDQLGLSLEDRQILIENVDIIIHSAATTRFDEKISVALKINVLGLKHMLDIAMNCKKIQAFIHVSTGYSHCYRKEIQEIFYDSPANLEMVYNLIAKDEADEISLKDEALKKVLGKWPNVYTFSKATAEGLVKEYSEKATFAVGVFRPTIIIAARKEPMPGWIGNNNGPTMVFMGMGLGILHIFYHDENNVDDFVPVDMTVNCLVAIVYDLVQKWQIEKKPIVYNYGSSTLNPLRVKEMSKWFLAEGPKIGSTHLLWYPFVFCFKSYWQFMIFHVIFHFIPALIVDVGRLFMRKKPKALKIFFFATKNLDLVDYFSNGDWRIHSNKSMELYDSLNKADQTIFDFDLRSLDWESMIVTYMRGARLYTLKEPFDNLDVAKKRYVRMRALHYILSSVFLLMIFYFLFSWLYNFLF